MVVVDGTRPSSSRTSRSMGVCMEMKGRGELTDRGGALKGAVSTGTSTYTKADTSEPTQLGPQKALITQQ